MRRLLPLALSMIALALAGCAKKPKDGNCASDKDCSAQQGYGKVCVQGRCQECAQDNECPAGFACKENKCAPRAECDETRPCAGGKACQSGRCVTDPNAAGQGAGASTEPARPAEPACQLQPVHFGYDEASLTAEARDLVSKDADCLKKLNAKRVSIAGHADERGTSEYNQHLAQRRAEAVRRYLGNLGLDAGSLDAVSFGKEQPICTESNEDCWKKNRRAELKAQ